jgi:hypothetical protein
MCSAATQASLCFNSVSTLSAGLATLRTPRAITLVRHSTSLHLPQPVVFKVPVRSSRTPITPDCGGSATSSHCLVRTSPLARIAAVRLSVGPLSPLADLSATLLTGSQSGAPAASHWQHWPCSGCENCNANTMRAQTNRPKALLAAKCYLDLHSKRFTPPIH